MAESPVVIVGCGDQKASPRWCAIDTCIAMENLVLATTGKGLGTCWAGGFNGNIVREMLKIPDHLKVVALLALGYPRQKLEKIVYLEEYEKKFAVPS